METLTQKGLKDSHSENAGKIIYNMKHNGKSASTLVLYIA